MDKKETVKNSAMTTRRTFLQAGGMAVLGFSAPAKANTNRMVETLAMDGGPRAVTIPADRMSAVTKWPRYGPEEKSVVMALFDSDQWEEQIPAFEKEIREYLQVPYVKAHNHGTSALMSLFFALDLPPGSELLAPSYTAWATTAPMHIFKYVPAFVDINPGTTTFDLEYAKKCLNSRTKAILPMHTFGNPCDMDEICDFAKQHGLIVLEDCAQAQGASVQGKQVGTWSSIAIYSFQSSKILPSIEGGLGMYQTREYYERATTFGNYELPETFPADSPYRTYQGTGFGPKLRMHPLAAAIARKQLPKIAAQNAMEDAQNRSFNQRLAELPGLSYPSTRPDAKRVYWGHHRLFIDEKKAGASRAALVMALQAEGVHISQGQYCEQHRYTLYSEPKWWHHPVVIPQDLHGTTQVNEQSVGLPLLHEEASDVIEQYIAAFEKVWAHRADLARS